MIYEQYQCMLNDLNEDYEILKGQYYGTEILAEVLHALDWLFSSWKTNDCLGYGAPEYVLTVIQQIEDAYEVEDQKKFNKTLYDEILDSYPIARSFYQRQFLEKCENKIFNMSDDDYHFYFKVDINNQSFQDLKKASKLYYDAKKMDILYNFIWE